MPNRPPSAFTLGQQVRVIAGARNGKPALATIRDILWHFSDERYGYYLDEGGKKNTKRYVEEDLEPVE